MATNLELLTEAVYNMEVNTHEEAIIEAFEDGELLTFAEWKKRGYKVRKGQKSVFSCTLWKKTSKKPSKEAEEVEEVKEADKSKKQSYFVKTKCCFFLPSQVEKISVAKAS